LKMRKKNIPNRGSTDLLAEKPLYLLPVYLIVFSAFFDTHAQMPVLAPYAVTLGATPFMLGIVVGAYSLFNIIGNFAGGATIDQRSWKLPLMLGLAGVSLVLLLYTLAGSAWQLAAIRAAHGFAGGLLVPAALACLTMGEGGSTLYGKRLAGFGASIGLAAITGPLAAGIIAGRFGYPAVYYSLAAMMLAAAITATTLVRGQAVCSTRPEQLPPTLKVISSRPKLQGAFSFAFGTMGATGMLASFLPVRAGMLGFSPARTGMLFASFALTAIIVQVLWPAGLKKIVKEDYVGCALGLLIVSIALVLAATLNFASGLFIALSLFGVGFGLSFQGMLGIVIGDSQTAWRGRAIGLFFAVYSLGVAIVPPVGGLIWQNADSIFPFYTAAAVALLSMAAGISLSLKTALKH
jgi:MFS transporter, DHA1 family, multidrug resistance protein